MSSEELHVVVDWTSFFEIDVMINYINESDLELKNIIKVNKLEHRGRTMSKFYGKRCVDHKTGLTTPCAKIVRGSAYKGKTDFLVYLILDKSPTHGLRDTGVSVPEKVNIKLFDLKKKRLRSIFGRRYKAYRIHGSNDAQEAKRNLEALEIFVDSDYNVKPSDNYSIIKYE